VRKKQWALKPTPGKPGVSLKRQHFEEAFMKAEVQKVLETIRPALQADGGDVELVSVENGVVKVRLQGACGSCPMATMTLKQGVEARLKERIPGVVRVESV
jgi:Fe-S cluster biogenesis protein NfuA